MKLKCIFILFIVLFLFGCTPEKIEDIDVFAQELIVFAADDKEDSVTSNFKLPLM